MNLNPIKVSIITPSFNQGQFIEQTIQSVLNQSYDNIEYIIIDGGSTDNTLDILNKYKDKIDVVISEKDKGQSDAINKGFKISSGTLVGWLNSDDILHPDCVRKIVELYSEKPDGVIYYSSNFNVIDAEGNFIKKATVKIPDRNYLLNIRYDVVQPGSFYLLEQVKKNGYLDETIFYCMDLDLWLKLLSDKKIYYINDDISYASFRLYSTTKTATGGSDFLKNIRSVLLKYKANPVSPNIRKTYVEQLKLFVKKLIHYSK